MKKEYVNGGNVATYGYQQIYFCQLPKTPEAINFHQKRGSAESITKTLDQFRGIKLLEKLKKNSREDPVSTGNVTEFDDFQTDITTIKDNILEEEK